jgi:branched-chain amino acid transport system substrate-binding protein
MQAPDRITVGALLSLSGDWSTLGMASGVALEIAARELNSAFERQGMATRVQLLAQDTRLRPDLAPQALHSLAERGVRVVIGPQSSAEMQALKAYADARGILLISQGSTSSTLSIAGDNLLRVVPDDRQEAAAVVSLMAADGVRNVVPVSRDDLGNRGLALSVRRAVEARGGSVAEGMLYAPSTVDFVPVLETIRGQVSQAIARHGAPTVGVYLAAFDEAALLFAAARNDPALASVKWYGSTGGAASPALRSGPAAEFAMKVGYPCPLLGLEESTRAKWQPVAEEIHARTGIAADAFALAAYDAFGVVTKAAIEAGGAEDSATFRQALLGTASRYSGITGSLELNEAGDRKFATYDFLALCGAGETAVWKRVALYQSLPEGGGTIQRLPGCGAP